MAMAVPRNSSARRQQFGRKHWLAIVLLLLAAIVTGSLGVWQMSRAEQKMAVAAEILEGRAAEPLALAQDVPLEALQPWRQVVARGVWLPQFSLLLDNRNHLGAPGYWLLTPLCLIPVDAPEFAEQAFEQAVACSDAVVVLRGWLPRARPDAEGSVLPVLPALPFEETIEGELLERVPRLFELTGWSGVGQDLAFGESLPLQQNIDLETYAQATGLSLLPVVLQQTTPLDDGLQRAWEGPAADAERNRGYALQWFTFSAIALIALGVFLVQVVRRTRHRRR